jgi:simple sugar transport system permease protein
MSDVALKPTSDPPPTAVDERLSKVSFLTKLLQRPELGAMLGAGIVLLFFVITADRFGTLSGMARWTDVASTLGIMAVAVALLMIGGEFDLSAGVMTGTAGLFMGILATELEMNIWLAIVLTFVLAAGIGFINGYMVVRTGLPSFIVTLATFFVLQGVNLGGTKAITDTVRVSGLSEAGGFDGAICAAMGALIIGMTFIGIQFSGWNTDWRYLFLGVILLAAVLVNTYIRRRAEGARR